MNLEHELRQALRRTSPPAGFDQRVLDRIASNAAVPAPSPQTRWTRLALPVAASLTLALAGGYYLQQHERQEQQVQAEQAARDVVQALQIASEKVSAVQVKVQEISHHERQVEY